MNSSNDTILAISTAIGKGSRSIIRLSGKNSIELAALSCTSSDIILNSKGYRFYKTFLNFLDLPIPCFIYVMRAPATYTRENMTELHIETISPLIQSKIISFFINKHNCRIAEPGEFTKRAYFNGRLDLIQAEAVTKIISATSDQQYRKALDALTGRVSNSIAPIREKLFFLVRDLTVDLDFDEEIEAEHIEDINNRLLLIQSDLKKIAENVEIDQNNTDEIKIIICGPVNAGKSTIFNQFVGENTAIVSPIRGTTRDIIKHEVQLNEHIFTLQDCPGWGEAVDELDALAQKQSKLSIESADIILCVLDGSLNFNQQKPITKPDWQNKAIVIINKNDLQCQLNSSEVSEYFQTPETEFIYISGKQSISELKSKINIKLETIETNVNNSILSARQQQELNQALNALQLALEAIELGIGIDAIEFEVRRCLYAISRLTGDEVDENILTSIFESFCIGK